MNEALFINVFVFLASLVAGFDSAYRYIKLNHEQFIPELHYSAATYILLYIFLILLNYTSSIDAGTILYLSSVPVVYVLSYYCFCKVFDHLGWRRPPDLNIDSTSSPSASE